MAFSFFLIIAISIVGAAHYMLFLSLGRLFVFAPVSLPKRIIGWAFGFLSISFFLFSALVRQYENVLTQWLYRASGFWLGTLTNLVLAAALAFVAIALLRVAGLRADRRLIAAVLFSSAVLVSLFGVWNAFHPQIRHVGVVLQDMPEEWKGKKIIQLSDVHLGNVYGAGFIEDVVQQVNAEDPDLVVITGDLFDGMDISLRELAEPLSRISSRKGTYYVTGNHETYLGVEKAYAALRPTGVRILDNEAVDLGGLALIGISYPLRGEKLSVAATLRGLREKYDGKPNILLFHAPIYREEFRVAGISLQLSGHTHKGQQYPFNLITRSIYDGFDYGLNRIGEYQIYTTNGVGTWGPPMRIGNTPEIVVITLE